MRGIVTYVLLSGHGWQVTLCDPICPIAAVCTVVEILNLKSLTLKFKRLKVCVVVTMLRC